MTDYHNPDRNSKVRSLGWSRASGGGRRRETAAAHNQEASWGLSR
jgi:hypothetical protein